MTRRAEDVPPLPCPLPPSGEFRWRPGDPVYPFTTDTSAGRDVNVTRRNPCPDDRDRSCAGMPGAAGSPPSPWWRGCGPTSGTHHRSGQ